MDATVHWKPLRHAIYHSFVGRSELIWGRAQQATFTNQSFGYYVSGEYQLGRRWFTGARFDRSSRLNQPNLLDTGGSLLLTYWPSEFANSRPTAAHRYAGSPAPPRTPLPTHVLHGRAWRPPVLRTITHGQINLLRALVRAALGISSPRREPMSSLPLRILPALGREIGGIGSTSTPSLAATRTRTSSSQAQFLLKLQKPTSSPWSGCNWKSAGCRASSNQSRNSRSRWARRAIWTFHNAWQHPSIPYRQQITRAMGDVHPMGNPHYWLDPENGRRIPRV